MSDSYGPAGPPTAPLTTLIPTITDVETASAAGPSGPMRPRPGAKRLRVDWPACKAHGLCHELMPELIALDEWGYPQVPQAPLRGGRLDDAKKAVSACPTLALRLVDVPKA